LPSTGTLLRIQNFIESILLYTPKSKNTKKKIRSQGFAHDYGKKRHNGIQELPESYHQSHVIRPPPILGSDPKTFPIKEGGAGCLLPTEYSHLF